MKLKNQLSYRDISYWLLESWSCVTVGEVGYHPKTSVFDESGMSLKINYVTNMTIKLNHNVFLNLTK